MAVKRDMLMIVTGALLALVLAAGVRYIRDHRTPLPYQSEGITIRWLPDTVMHWKNQINNSAKKYNVDANLVAIVMTMESGGDASAKSQDNAVGLMQITEPTAKDIANKYLKQPTSNYNLQDPATNIEFGTAYLAFLRDEFGERDQAPSWNVTVELVAASYNGGPGAGGSLYQGKGLHDTETVVYSRDAYNMWRERHASSSPTFDRWKERGGTILLDAAKTSQSK